MRLAPAERGFGSIPWRQPVDLSANYTIEKLGGTSGKFERPEKKTLGFRVSSMRLPRIARGNRLRNSADDLTVSYPDAVGGWNRVRSSCGA